MIRLPAVAEHVHRIEPERYEAQVPLLRAGLLDAQVALRQSKFAVVMSVSGPDAAGKGELVHRLNEWLDPRGVETHAFWTETDEERERPRQWRFWRELPARGRIGIFFGSWYAAPIVQRTQRECKRRAFETELDHITRFEEMLAADGTLILKVWLHLPKAVQKKRLKKLEAEGRLGPDDWEHFQLYDKFTVVSAEAIRRTSTQAAQWHVIDATDRRYRELTAGSLLLNALRARLDTPPVRASGRPATRRTSAGRRGALAGVDLSQRLAPAEYEVELPRLQRKLSKLTWAAQERKVSCVLVFEGWDAAGKGSAIRRVTQAIDPRLYRVVGIAAPNDEERSHHYLWRFWRHLPRAGFITLFDRSWYGRVLVERVEGFASAAEWTRAYDEINEFEALLIERGIVLAKFWLHLSPAEQLRRFQERQTVRHKQYKITDEDWRNRDKWEAYRQAVDETIARCSLPAARWTLVAGDDKRFARVQILRTLVERLEAAL